VLSQGEEADGLVSDEDVAITSLGEESIDPVFQETVPTMSLKI
jgi:hypothetical protein